MRALGDFFCSLVEHISYVTFLALSAPPDGSALLGHARLTAQVLGNATTFFEYLAFDGLAEAETVLVPREQHTQCTHAHDRKYCTHHFLLPNDNAQITSTAIAVMRP